MVVHDDKETGTSKYQRVHMDDENWPPKWWKLLLVFDDGTRFAFTDMRRFGRLSLHKDPLNEDPLNRLGFDPLLDMPTLARFTELLRGHAHRKALKMKALLLDQAFSAGVGNWVADEVLYQARMHPEQPVCDLSAAQVKALHDALNMVIQVRGGCRAARHPLG